MSLRERILTAAEDIRTVAMDVEATWTYPPTPALNVLYDNYDELYNAADELLSMTETIKERIEEALQAQEQAAMFKAQAEESLKEALA